MANQILGDSFGGDTYASRYKVQQQLAKKAGRRTMLARDLKTQELVVVKLLSFSSDFEWDDLKLFKREAETLKAIAHPCIPRYLDDFELNLPNLKGFALIQSYIQAKSLEEHLLAGLTFSEAEVKQIAKELLKILIYLHKRQPPVIHRDIKPSNVLLNNRSGNSVGQVYIVDFGSVQTLVAKGGGTMTVVGTYGYMPPEQFGERTVPASDLYSLGATLIALVTGTHPADLPQKDGRIQFEQVTDLSPAFAGWLRHMTEPSLDRRFSSAAIALQALEQELQGGTTPVVFKKPFGSKLLLTKNTDFLEIVVPPREFSTEIVVLMLFAIPFNLLVMCMGIPALLFTPTFNIFINIFFALFTLPIWGAGISMMWQVLCILFGRVRIYLDRQQIFRTYELFGFKYRRSRPIPKQDIYKLELEYLGNIKHRLILQAGIHRYEIGGDNHISEPELNWLANELSDWLGLPIQVRR